jgi:hypothetical protein
MRALLAEQRVEFPNWFYTGPFILWVLFVTWGSLTPPGWLWQFEFRWADKIEHGLSYTVLGALFLRAWVRETAPGPRAAMQVWMLTFLWGAYLELWQALTPLRTMDWRDGVVNGVGAALGVVLWVAIAACWRRWAPPALAAPPPVDTWDI